MKSEGKVKTESPKDSSTSKPSPVGTRKMGRSKETSSFEMRTLRLLPDQTSSDRARPLMSLLHYLFRRLRKAFPGDGKIKHSRYVLANFTDSQRIKQLAQDRHLDSKAIVEALLDYAQEAAGILPDKKLSQLCLEQTSDSELDIKLAEIRRYGLRYDAWPIPLTVAGIREANKLALEGKLPPKQASAPKRKTTPRKPAHSDEKQRDEGAAGPSKTPSAAISEGRTRKKQASSALAPAEGPQSAAAKPEAAPSLAGSHRTRRTVEQPADSTAAANGFKVPSSTATPANTAVSSEQPSLGRPKRMKKEPSGGGAATETAATVAAVGPALAPVVAPLDQPVAMETLATANAGQNAAVQPPHDEENAAAGGAGGARRRTSSRKAAKRPVPRDYSTDYEDNMDDSEDDGSDSGEDKEESSPARKKVKQWNFGASGSRHSDGPSLLPDEERQKCFWLRRTGLDAESFRDKNLRHNPPAPLKASDLISCHDCQGAHVRQECQSGRVCAKSYCQQCCRHYEYLFLTSEPGDKLRSLWERFCQGACPCCLDVCVRKFCLRGVPKEPAQVPPVKPQEKRIMALHMAASLVEPAAALAAEEEKEASRQGQTVAGVAEMPVKSFSGYRLLCNRCATSMHNVIVHCECGADICVQCCDDLTAGGSKELECPVCSQQGSLSISRVLRTSMVDKLASAQSIVDKARELKDAAVNAYDYHCRLWKIPTPEDESKGPEKRPHCMSVPVPHQNGLQEADGPSAADVNVTAPSGSKQLSFSNGPTGASQISGELSLEPSAGMTSSADRHMLRKSQSSAPQSKGVSNASEIDGALPMGLQKAPAPLAQLRSFNDAVSRAPEALKRYLGLPAEVTDVPVMSIVSKLLNGDMTVKRNSVEAKEMMDLVDFSQRVQNANGNSLAYPATAGGAWMPPQQPPMLQQNFQQWFAAAAAPPPRPANGPAAAPDVGMAAAAAGAVAAVPQVVRLPTRRLTAIPGCIDLTSWHVDLPPEDYRLAAQRPDGVQNYIWTPHVRDFASDSPRRLETVERFVQRWAAGEPIIIRGMRGKMNWGPTVVMRAARDLKAGQSTIDVIDCSDWSAECAISAQTFFRLYRECHGPVTDTNNQPLKMYKLKDFPPDASFAEKCKRHYDDFISMLNEVMPEYMNPTAGVLNLASKLPATAVPPDLGPKGYIAFGRETEHQGEGDSVTRLHEDLSDAINIMCHVQRPPEVKQALKARCGTAPLALPSCNGAGALWDLYRREDVPTVRQFLLDVVAGKVPNCPPFYFKGKQLGLEDVVDVVHDQSFMLTHAHRAALALPPYNVHSWLVEQYENEGVVIPAACAHQVRNLRASIKIALDFVSPESVEHCINQRAERRVLAQAERPVLSIEEDVQERHFQDKLQVANMVVHAMAEALDVLEKKPVPFGEEEEEEAAEGGGAAKAAQRQTRTRNAPL